MRTAPDPDVDNVQSDARPQYMVVGNGVTSEYAAQLQNMLDVDSGYGGSLIGDDFDAPISKDATRDVSNAHSASLSQMWYFRQRAVLSRSINRVSELLQSLQEMNSSWVVYYPSVQAANNGSEIPSRPQSIIDEPIGTASPSDRPSTPAALTTQSSVLSETRSIAEPRLVTSQVLREFSILKLDLKLGSLHQADLLHSLEKKSIASLLDSKISSSMKHLRSLQERIEDTSSKVLITGDLNAGKSTFCNALLRRKVLPEDQQPCTAIFCEVLDARENAGVEEVHAIHKGVSYNRIDESTYDVFSLKELDQIVTENETYTQCKVYVQDSRTVEESLLNNGVVDIALIDAPGLNSDTTKTTAIFARQEEIDVVVFVVSASNHFTQSAKEFIQTAAAEKSYLFIVVNGYDTIRDKNRAQRLIMDQLAGISPQTHKEASDLVHFVSSNVINSGSSSSGGPSGSGGGDDGDDPKGDPERSDKLRDFEALEQSLRRFVLEKRARSKLAPAKTYLFNILNDIHSLATVNESAAKSEMSQAENDLQELEPKLRSTQKAKSDVNDEMERNIEETCNDVYNHTRSELGSAITHAGQRDHNIPYPGLIGAFQYADALKEAMLSHIVTTVSKCEDYARGKTVKGVNTIKQLGILHVGDEFQNLQFRADVMFKQKRDALGRQVNVPTQIWDFIDWSSFIKTHEKFAGTSLALTVAGSVVPQMIGMGTRLDQALTATRLLSYDQFRQLILPGLAIAGKFCICLVCELWFANLLIR